MCTAGEETFTSSYGGDLPARALIWIWGYTASAKGRSWGGLCVSAGNRTISAEPVPKSEKEFYGILYDSTRCAGCQGCEFACAEAHGLTAPSFEDVPVIGTERKADETRRTVVNAYQTSKGEVYVKRQCMHCSDPACTAACLTRAMYKTEDGPVIWRGKKCMGCRYCMVSCPFDVPKFEYLSPNPKIVKCDMCFDRMQEGKVPACAEQCPTAVSCIWYQA